MNIKQATDSKEEFKLMWRILDKFIEETPHEWWRNRVEYDLGVKLRDVAKYYAEKQS